MPVIVPVLAMCSAAYGAVAGALLPRAVYRLAVPPETPWRRQCPSGHRLAGPAHGWLGRARCPACAGATPEVPASYGTSERLLAGICASACAALALSVGVRPELAVWLTAAPIVLLLTAVDIRAQRLPDILTLPLTAATAALLGVAALATGAGGSWTGALLGGTVLAAGFFVLFLINPRGMGFGDVKLAAPLGLALGWYGWDTVLAGTLLAFLFAAGYGVTLLLAGRASWKTSVPFGPFLAAGTLAGIVLGGLTT
ncbi:prepilin peptidase [Streptomyces sp. HNM0575]|uniref:prepilin peptidase n=1 Tax=Streptomyces sp. HNM0575 TaxID=2716338 RepID=UPI00145CA046|nr:A24 family peptidase [Streptomyces sp. HNM0575]NLU74942.1 prepilin peptidase [Streptomyces sp. HNM0575]